MSLSCNANYTTIDLDMTTLNYYLGFNCVLASISGCILTYYTTTGNYKSRSISNFLCLLFLLLVAGPISEESIFRHTLIYATQHLSYYVELNVALFSGIHLSNYYYSRCIYSSLAQVGFAIYLGYYLIILNNVYKGMIIHGIYNLIILIISCIFDELVIKKKLGIKKISSSISSYNNFVPLYIKKSKSVPSRLNRMSDNDKYFFRTSIPKNKFPTDLVESFDKYNSVCNNLENNFEKIQIMKK